MLVAVLAPLVVLLAAVGLERLEAHALPGPRATAEPAPAASPAAPEPVGEPAPRLRPVPAAPAPSPGVAVRDVVAGLPAAS